MAQIVDLRKKTTETKEIEKLIPEKKEASLIEPENTENNTPRPATGKLIKKTDRFEWETPSFFYNPPKKNLVLIVTALLCGSGILIFYYQDVLMAIFLILSSFVIVLYANKQPSILKIVVNNSSIKIDDVAYYYRELKSFWLDYDPHGIKEISLESKKWYIPYVKISIENQNPVSLRALIIRFVPEKEHEKSLTDLISRKMGL